MSSPTCHFHHCAVIFSQFHDERFIQKLKAFFEQFFLSTMTYQNDAEAEHQTAIFYLFY